MSKGKHIIDAYKEVDNNKLHSIKEAIEILLKNKRKNFTFTWDQRTFRF